MLAVIFCIFGISFTCGVNQSLIIDGYDTENVLWSQKAGKSLPLPICSEPVCVGPLSDIYCHGELLHTAWIFGLEKVCPGQKMTQKPDKILADFRSLPTPVQRGDFEKFCLRNFATVPYLVQAELSDWVEEPPYLQLINDTSIRNFTKQLNAVWKILGRRFNREVLTNPSMFSVNSVSNNFVVPGGRFDIYFYWDSYWILKGLIFSNMFITSEGVIQNFKSLIDRLGFIPNSGYIQLSRRSQPPLFTQMIADLYENTRNTTFLKEMLPFVEAEFSWWKQNRSVMVTSSGGQKYSLFQYNASSNCPRPESYFADLVNGLKGNVSPQFTWSSIASACESGLDFTSRWFEVNGTLSTIRTSTIIPVDLNVFMAWNYLTAADMCSSLGEHQKSEKYRSLGENLKNAIHNLMWNETDGVWYDYDMVRQLHRTKFYPSNVYPLLLGDFGISAPEKVFNYLMRINIHSFKGGVPASLDEKSGEQWDFPNGWAPSIYLFVISLQKSGYMQLEELSKTIALRFIRTVFNGLMNPPQGQNPGCWEKYDIRYDDGRVGQGGEYIVQQGFGWTNGVVLDLIRRFYVSPQHNNSGSQMNVRSNANKYMEKTLSTFWIIILAAIFCWSLAIWIFVVILSKLYTERKWSTRRNYAFAVDNSQVECDQLLLNEINN